jgi:threonine/homoserine/homoserine lactone efflux protein
VTVTTTQIQTQTSAAAPPPATTTLAATTTSGVNPAAAAAAGAAAASNNNEDSSSTQWGWIAFGILAAAVLVIGLVWWLRKRGSAPTDGGPAPPVGTG